MKRILLHSAWLETNLGLFVECLVTISGRRLTTLHNILGFSINVSAYNIGGIEKDVIDFDLWLCGPLTYAAHINSTNNSDIKPS